MRPESTRRVASAPASVRPRAASSGAPSKTGGCTPGRQLAGLRRPSALETKPTPVTAVQQRCWSQWPIRPWPPSQPWQAPVLWGLLLAKWPCGMRPGKPCRAGQQQRRALLRSICREQSPLHGHPGPRPVLRRAAGQPTFGRPLFLCCARGSGVALAASASRAGTREAEPSRTAKCNTRSLLLAAPQRSSDSYREQTESRSMAALIADVLPRLRELDIVLASTSTRR